MAPGLMDEARRVAATLCRDGRVLLQALALPNVGDPTAALDAMDAVAGTYPIVAWKVFTNYPDLYEGSRNAWRLDDADPSLALVGEAFIERAATLGIPTICAHKGFSSTLGFRSAYASPADFGGAAARHRDLRFVAYHSGYEPDLVEGSYDDTRRGIGVNRLIASMLDNGVGPNENLYAELGSTWWSLMGTPDQAAHVLGKLLRYVGEDNVLWGTDALFYGAPQDQIQAFRAFQISVEFQERFGYPALTDAIKRKVLGLNALRLHDVDPITVPCEFTREELAQIRLTLPTGNETFGPTTPTETAAYVAAHQGMP
jgi:predicted TIM-barrel fold metal-dependent hydrolase